MSSQPARPQLVRRRELAELVRLLPGAAHAGPHATANERGADVVLSGVTQDSAAVRPGDLYLARPGARVHGAAFAAHAVAAGAVAVLTDGRGAELAAPVDAPVIVVPDPAAVAGAVASWVYGDPARDLRMFGVTGTNGKTTTAYLIDAGLRATGASTGLIGTIATVVGGEVIPSVRTTPEATDLQALLALMVERGIDSVAMEVSSHALEQRRIDGVRFAVAAFTNLTQDHLDFHHDMESYFAAKARLFTPALSESAVVVVDDSYGERLAAAATVPVTTLAGPATTAAADWRISDAEPAGAGTAFRLTGPTGADFAASCRLPGEFNVLNAATAIVTLVTAGLPAEQVIAGVAALPAVPGRLEPVELGQPFAAYVDYAHTPAAVEALLAAVRRHTPGRVLVVLGCGGDRDADKRPGMGAAAARGADIAVLTSDNPRSEDPAAILAALAAGARSVTAEQRAEVIVEIDRATAIATAVAQARPGDTVVVAGKGHESGQEIAGVITPFDDRAVLAEQIARGGGGR